MRTNSKQVKTKVQEYILSCLDSDGNFDDLKGKLINVCEEFKSAAVYKNNILRHKTWQNVFIDWLNGLPSSLSIEFYTHEIMKIMESFGLPLPANKTEEEGIYLFHYLIYSNFLSMCKREKIDFYSYLNYTK